MFHIVWLKNCRKLRGNTNKYWPTGEKVHGERNPRHWSGPINFPSRHRFQIYTAITIVHHITSHWDTLINHINIMEQSETDSRIYLNFWNKNWHTMVANVNARNKPLNPYCISGSYRCSTRLSLNFYPSENEETHEVVVTCQTNNNNKKGISHRIQQTER